MRTKLHLMERTLVFGRSVRRLVRRQVALLRNCEHPWTRGFFLRRSVMRTGIAMGLAISLLLGADAVKDAETLQGTWRLSAGESNGKALSEKQLKDGNLVIKGNHYSVTLDGRGTVTGVQKLDPTPRTKTID